MKRKTIQLAQRYEAALRVCIGEGPDPNLDVATELGNRAVALGMETLDLALIHEEAVIAQVFAVGAKTDRDRMIKRARVFFAAAIIPMEATHRSALEDNVHLSRLNLALIRRTSDLTASNRRLRLEVAKRKTAERTLFKSERHSSRLLDQSRRLQERLRHLSRRLLSAQEEERKRISRELHDVIAQMLTGINVRLATLKLEARTNARGLGKKIAHTQRLVERSVDIVHRFARELRPAVLDDLGLIPALHTFVKGFTKETGIRVVLTAFAGVEDLSSAKRTALYRIVQEALTNVARHAHASRVEVKIEALPHGLCMRIQDDGRSFNVARMWLTSKNEHLGLLGMRERLEMIGGRFSVESSPGQGTTIKALLPCRSPVKDHTHS